MSDELTKAPSARPASSSQSTIAGLTSQFDATRGATSSRSRRARQVRRQVLNLRTRFGELTRGVGSVITGVGWFAICAVVACLALGYSLGWLEFAVIGIALALLLGISLLFLVGQARYDIELYVNDNRTVVGKPVTAGVRIADAGRRPLWAARVEVQLGDETIELRLPPRRAKERTESEFLVPADRRGVVTVGPVQTVQGDPIGFFRRNKVWTHTVDVFVHPRTIGIPSTSTGFVRDLEGNPTRDLTASDISFHALREYRSGDERRHIHWKATARTGQLTVRQFEETRRSHIVVAFGLSERDYTTDDEFELAAEAAASIALRAVRDGHELSVVTSPPKSLPGDDPSRSPRFLNSFSRARLLDDVSELVLGDTNIDLGGLAKLASTAVAGISLVFLVCGSKPSIRELRSWSLRFPAGVEIVAVVCRPAQLPTHRRISELSVLSIGYLEDLRKALAKAAAA